MKKLRRKIRLSLEGNDLKEMGEEASLILEAIKKNGTISEASRELSISYKHTWSVLRKLREILGEEVVEATHGGRGGGGKSILTEAGNSLLEEYRRVEEGLSGVLREEGFWETLGLKISARNRFSGKVKWFNGVKGYGFIRREGKEKDIFVHFSAVRNAGLKHLKEGEQLTFEVENSGKGPSAVNLQKTN